MCVMWAFWKRSIQIALWSLHQLQNLLKGIWNMSLNKWVTMAPRGRNSLLYDRAMDMRAAQGSLRRTRGVLLMWFNNIGRPQSWLSSIELEVAVKAMRASHTVRPVRFLPKVFKRRSGRFTGWVTSFCGSIECPMQLPTMLNMEPIQA